MTRPFLVGAQPLSAARPTTSWPKTGMPTPIEGRGILYVPDYVANAGGLINGARELSRAPLETKAAIRAIYDTTLKILTIASSQKITPAQAADRLAEERLGSR